MKQEVAEANNIKVHVQQMFDDGVLKQDKDGIFQVVEDHAEREHIREQVAHATKSKYANAPKKEAQQFITSTLVDHQDDMSEEDLE